MEKLKLLSTGTNPQTVKESYVLPPELRPGNLKNSCKTIPVIDLGGGGISGGDESIVNQIYNAAREFGCFQVLPISSECQVQKIIADLLQLPIPGCQIVLGANWLSTLGNITWNFQELTMKFEEQGVVKLFRGGKAQTNQLQEPDTKDLRQKSQIFVIQLCLVEKINYMPDAGPEAGSERTEISSLLRKYDYLFDEPKGFNALSALDRKKKTLLVLELGHENAVHDSTNLKQLLELEELLASAK